MQCQTQNGPKLPPSPCIASCCETINGPWGAVRSGPIISTMARKPGMTTAEFSKPRSEAEDKAWEALRA